MGNDSGLDFAWAERTGGNLAPAERRRLLRPLLRSVPRLAAERTHAARGRRGTASVEPAGMVFPDTHLAREAEAEARGVLSPVVLQHSYRTYLFGLALAQIDGVQTDHELAFTASMLHDLNLEHPTPGRCFAVVGGQRAERFALDHGAPPTVAREIGAAVSGHLTPGVADDLSDLGGFVSAGALLDVTGFRVTEIDKLWVRDVLDRHPRLEFKRQLAIAIAEERRLVPNGRAAWLSRWARFQLLIKLAPFAE